MLPSGQRREALLEGDAGFGRQRRCSICFFASTLPCLCAHLRLSVPFCFDSILRARRRSSQQVCRHRITGQQLSEHPAADAGETSSVTRRVFEAPFGFLPLAAAAAARTRASWYPPTGHKPTPISSSTFLISI